MPIEQTRRRTGSVTGKGRMMSGTAAIESESLSDGVSVVSKSRRSCCCRCCLRVSVESGEEEGVDFFVTPAILH